MWHYSTEHHSVYLFKVSFLKASKIVFPCFLQMFVLFFISLLLFYVFQCKERFDNFSKRFNKKRWNVQQQSSSGSGVNEVSKKVKYFKEYSFWNGWNHLFNQEEPSLIFRTKKII